MTNTDKHELALVLRIEKQIYLMFLCIRNCIIIFEAIPKMVLCLLLRVIS